MPRPDLASPLTPLRWDVFCRVIDNHGDLGVCWRLARDLAGRGYQVRLWIDDDAALAWMAPGGAPGIEVRPWGPPAPGEVPGDVVIEAFGCDPPDTFVHAMQAHPGSLWINLEYLSAEAYVERSHGLASPQLSGPGRGLTKWFFYPGFTPATGGLLREPDLLARRKAFDRNIFLRELGVPVDQAMRVSVFAYPDSPVDELLQRLAPLGCRLLACPGPTQQALLAAAADYPTLQITALPWLSQIDYDRLLWSCDLNFVRGEDSFVRAQWAGQPFVWQIYEQDDGVHAEKLAAFLQRHLAEASPDLRERITALWRAWNRLGTWPQDLPAAPDWLTHSQRWTARLTEQPDLVSQLQGFVLSKR